MEETTSQKIDHIITKIGISTMDVGNLTKSNGGCLQGNRLRIEAYHLLRDAQRKLRLLHDELRNAND